ncbi:MAG TPA: nickel pincer cofactor biosynthesis protein LarC [Acidimicrobiales bacterium]|nr:nickel pincer cofactor biosynthesis protein LarC [Acidimicrobiales bacterium]
MSVAWFHCFAGIAGDMALGSLVDAGADLHEVVGLLKRLPLTGWTLDANTVQRGGIAGTQIRVGSEDDGIVRTHANIQGLIQEARLPDRVHERALATFAALADVEGRLHRRPPSQVHFHEVGGIDAIVDIVGTCAALEILEVDEVRSSPVATGMGMIRSSHGALPNPAPAVVALLKGAPTYGRDLNVELTTPTGAALLAALVSTYGPLPAMTIEATGFGAGTRELDTLPNLTQVVLGALTAGTGAEPSQPVILLEANVDDASGETLAHAITSLLAAGAHDAWITPIVMKKGRPAYTVGALADPALAAQVAQVLRLETGSLGIRGSTLERWPAARTEDEVEVNGIHVRVKISAGRVKVEHDDAARAARRTGRPLREVVSRAEAEFHRLHPGTTSGSGGGQGDEAG